MERTLLETIHALGLDIQLAIVLVLLALDALGTLGRRIASWRAAQPRRVSRRSIFNRPSAATDIEPCAPESLSAICGTAA